MWTYIPGEKFNFILEVSIWPVWNVNMFSFLCLLQRKRSLHLTCVECELFNEWKARFLAYLSPSDLCGMWTRNRDCALFYLFLVSIWPVWNVNLLVNLPLILALSVSIWPVWNVNILSRLTIHTNDSGLHLTCVECEHFETIQNPHHFVSLHLTCVECELMFPWWNGW